MKRPDLHTYGACDHPPTVTCDGKAADHRLFAGCRSLRRARSTGTVVGIYDGYASGMANRDEVAAGLDSRWATVCERHSWIVTHETLALARFHATTPEAWCDECRDEYDYERASR